MLTVTLTPTHLVFKNLTDELQQDIEKRFGFEFEFIKDKPNLTGKPKDLYRMLYLLSTYYDIELT